MGAITTHILDVSRGRPAGGVAVRLEKLEGAEVRVVGEGRTDGDGRLRTLMGAGAALERGVYRLTFEVGAYFAGVGVEAFYPSVEVVFEVREVGEHYHVPLLVSPFGYSTYRGS